MTKIRAKLIVVTLLVLAVVAALAANDYIGFGVDEGSDQPEVRLTVEYLRQKRDPGGPVKPFRRIFVHWEVGTERGEGTSAEGAWGHSIHHSVPPGTPLLISAREARPIEFVEMRCTIRAYGRIIAVQPPDGGFRAWPTGEVLCSAVMPP